MLVLHPGVLESRILELFETGAGWTTEVLQLSYPSGCVCPSLHPCACKPGWDFFEVPEHQGPQISFVGISLFFLPFVSSSLSSPLAIGSLHRSVPLSPRQSRGGEQGCCNSQAQVRAPRRSLPPGTAPAAAADSPLEIMCCGRERLSRPRRSAGAGTAQQPGATTPVSRLRGA